MMHGARRRRSLTLLVLKTHRINGVGKTFLRRAPLVVDVPDDGVPVPRSLLFLSSRGGDPRGALAALEPRPSNMILAAVQDYDAFVEAGTRASLRRYREIFPGLSPDQWRLVADYLDLWQILRTCCGPQSSSARQTELHGLPPARPADAYDAPRCAIYDLDAVEEALFNTSLWRWHFADVGADFLAEKDMAVRRGVCCYSTIAARNGAGWRGKWYPTDAERAYLAVHGDPRDHPVTRDEADAACHHRNFASRFADAVKCTHRGRDGARTFIPCPKRAGS